MRLPAPIDAAPDAADAPTPDAAVDASVPSDGCVPRVGSCPRCGVDDDCHGDTPVCDEGVCRGCRRHAECASGVCGAVGECFAPPHVLYVANGGTGESCDQAAPCGSIAAALAKATPTRYRIRLAPDAYRENVEILAKDAILIGEGAELTPSSEDRALVTVGGSARVALDSLRIRGSTVSGVVCTGDAASEPILSCSVRMSSPIIPV